MPDRNVLFPPLQITTEKLTREFDLISEERRGLLRQLTHYVKSRPNTWKVASINFICTHNSRRSHIAQIWAQTAAFYYNVDKVECFSGGTEATAFNPRAVNAMKGVGFHVETKKDGDNPVYEVAFSQSARTITSFSKKYDDPFNHYQDFAAVMTCSHADENCPHIPRASSRIALTFEDPKAFDGTAQESAMYLERVYQIGREILYAFSVVKSGS